MPWYCHRNRGGYCQIYFVESLSGCISDSTDIITVSINQRHPSLVTIRLCIGETSSAIPATGGVWISNNPGIAIINNAGIITAAGQGPGGFTYTPLGGCPSDPGVLLLSMANR